ncbi:MAG: DUF2238 domain-containing protein [Planctomycetes bacterium]|nr:DUF2238 domain-containing protein [Planctomycetota bacterium]
MPHRTKLLLAWMALLVVASYFGPADTFTWFLEVAPILIAAPILILSAKRFPLTPLLTLLIGVHAAILALGGTYTYAEVPFGYWLRDLFGFERNPYDRLGHFAQGFVPAILAREVLLRTSPLRPGKWLAFLCVSVCLAFSAFYELVEWWAAASTGEAAESFLGTQGDVWDTQWDMFLALIGACTSLALLSKLHAKQLARVVSA